MSMNLVLKLSGIKGSSKITNYTDAIDIYSFSFAGSQTGTFGHVGKVTLDALNVMKKTDTSSPAFFSALCGSQPIASGTLYCIAATGNTNFVRYQLDMTNILVTSLQLSGSSGGDDFPTESISLSYTTLKVTYTPQNTDGTPAQPIASNWNLIANTAS